MSRFYRRNALRDHHARRLDRMAAASWLADRAFGKPAMMADKIDAEPDRHE